MYGWYACMYGKGTCSAEVHRGCSRNAGKTSERIFSDIEVWEYGIPEGRVNIGVNPRGVLSVS